MPARPALRRPRRIDEQKLRRRHLERHVSTASWKATPAATADPTTRSPQKTATSTSSRRSSSTARAEFPTKRTSTSIATARPSSWRRWIQRTSAYRHWSKASAKSIAASTPIARMQVSPKDTHMAFVTGQPGAPVRQRGPLGDVSVRPRGPHDHLRLLHSQWSSAGFKRRRQPERALHVQRRARSVHHRRRTCPRRHERSPGRLRVRRRACPADHHRHRRDHGHRTASWPPSSASRGWTGSVQTGETSTSRPSTR